MNSLILFTSLFLIPVLSRGNVCPMSSGLAKKWQEQKTWDALILTPSASNPALQIKALKDQNNQIYLAPIDLKGNYKASMQIDIRSIYKPKRFAEYCAKSETHGTILTNARLDKSNGNQFRMNLNYLPSPALSAKSPYVLQQFSSDSGGIGVVVTLREGSLVMKNEEWSFNKVLAAELGEKISRDLQKQIGKEVTGSVTLNLDGLDDLACDLLKGHAQLRFFHRGKMQDAKANVVEEILTQDLWNLYDELTSALAPIGNKDHRLFTAGATWMQNSSALPSLGLQPLKALNIIQQMTTLDSSSPMKTMNEETMECLAIGESKFKINTYNALVSIEVSTQTLNELQLMNESKL